MEGYLSEWLNLLLRWFHVIVAIAWIGESFHFVAVDNSLKKPEDPEAEKRGVGGEYWCVHGGGFYNFQKYRVAPAVLPKSLHWSFIPSYSTALSGLALISVLYYWNASSYLIDRSVLDIPGWAGVLIGIAFLAGGWLVYDRLCKSKLGQDERKLGLAVAAYCVVAAFLLCHVFSGRGAFLHFGGMLALIMTANVFFVIIPGQREMVRAAQEGREVDPEPGRRGKQRSVHNTYFTLPVLFAMISNHYAVTYGSSWNWLVLLAIAASGALIRHFFVMRHRGEKHVWALAVSAVLLLAVFFGLMPAAPKAVAGVSNAELFAKAQRVIDARCVQCHAAKPSPQFGFPSPPKGVAFDTPEQIVANAQGIQQQVVVAKSMPLGNLTQMTDDERQTIATWISAGAKAK
ncbi:putative membrane protein [Plasticicumulans lactativorans]|uniref:Putative membrane protein n=1 Tax=Plasticicumulans lactativorans TaxID=1133106 RepID=A0A4R2L024_9GAMM|nr:urate hydroxylase PuuD [Plasticicumulans lactativorans]TCO79744.1 putative membrane protein [Plasticicumulans lactativorans]